MVKLKINDIEVEVEEGTNLIVAAKEVGVTVPHFCYHPALSLSGTCRMCYVKIEGMPKLQIGCNIMAKEGMEVYTEADEVIRERKALLEFFLLNHPLDCPICDKGGECPLQDYTMKHGQGESRYHFQKSTRYKRRPLSDRIIFDPERCVLCLRCTRFTEEITGTNELWVKDRSEGKEITLFHGRPLHNGFQGNLPDICPVGALTSTDFRFKARVWELEKTDSICNLCSVGCNITTWTRKNDVIRLTPRVNMEVNEWWMCDMGRYGYHYINSEDRANRPHIRENGKLIPVSWETAIARAAEGFSEARSKGGAASLGGLISPRCSNEDAYLFQKLMRSVLQTPNIDNGLNPSAREQLAYFREDGRTASSLSSLDNADTILIFGEDLTEEHPVFSLRVRRAVTGNGAKLVIAHSGPTELDSVCSQKLDYREGEEKMMLMGLVKSMVQEPPSSARLKEEANLIKETSLDAVSREAGVSVQEITDAAGILGGGNRKVILFNYDNSDDDLLRMLEFFPTIMGGSEGLSIIMLGEGGNLRGTEDLGVSPAWLPGYVAGARSGELKEFYPSTPVECLSDKGLSGGELIAGAEKGEVKALFMVGMDTSDGERRALDGLDFLVVQDLFITGTAEKADVFFPSPSVAEKTGSFTNALGAVQRFKRSFKPIGDCREEWKVFSQLATALGTDFNYSGVKDIQEEINKLWVKLTGNPYIDQ